MSERHEFVLLASRENAKVRQLCRQFGISSATAYKWLRRFQEQGVQGLEEHSRRPHHSPLLTPPRIEAAVIKQRGKHPSWGGRKLRDRLLNLGHERVPSASTITRILERNNLLTNEAALRQKPWLRFVHPQPNDLWQMDFKGDFALGGGRCYPLTVLDDHSRFALGLVACTDQKTETVRTALVSIFRRYGLPWRMAMDNGAPWAGYHHDHTRYTQFSVWLIRLGIRLSFSRPYHPQTQGKVERFHRTLAVELLRDQLWPNRQQCQRAFEKWRTQYNLIRPHEALEMKVPATCYQVSGRPFPDQLPSIEYDDHELTRIVGRWGQVKHHQRKFYLGTAFAGLRVAIRPTITDGLFDVYLSHQWIGSIDLKLNPSTH